METKVKILLIGTGVLMSLLVACTPLTSYVSAANFPCIQFGQEGDADYRVECDKPATSGSSTKVNLNVNSLLILDAASGDRIAANPSNTATGNISATVRSSRNYTISLSAEQPNLLKSDDNSYLIPAKATLTPGTDAWGIKMTDATDYTAITREPVVFYEGAATPLTEGSGRQTDFEVGVTVSSSLPAGTYSTAVTVTAAIKE